jgi:hypothetical protein
MPCVATLWLTRLHEHTQHCHIWKYMYETIGYYLSLHGNLRSCGAGTSPNRSTEQTPRASQSALRSSCCFECSFMTMAGVYIHNKKCPTTKPILDLLLPTTLARIHQNHLVPLGHLRKQKKPNDINLRNGARPNQAKVHTQKDESTNIKKTMAPTPLLPPTIPLRLQTHLAPKLHKLQNIAAFLQEIHDIPSELAKDEDFFLKVVLCSVLVQILMLPLLLGFLWALVIVGFAVYRRLVWERRERRRCEEAGGGGEPRPWPEAKGIILGLDASGRGVVD